MLLLINVINVISIKTYLLSNI